MVILLDHVIRIGTNPLGKHYTIDSLLNASLTDLMNEAATLRDEGHADRLSYSRKVFIPLTRLCRDSCSYCTGAELHLRAVQALNRKMGSFLETPRWVSSLDAQREQA